MIAGDPRTSGTTPPVDTDSRASVAELEMHLLLDGVARLSGFDFREYSPTLLKRRVSERVRAEDVRSIVGLLERVVHEPAALERFVHGMTTAPSAPFRDVAFFTSLASDVIPRLRTYPFFRLWVVGNASDAYALAILLHEAGLLGRVRIYATEASESALAEAKLGLITPEALGEAEERYRACGGTRTFAEYLETTPAGSAYKAMLGQNVLFARHHLAAEGSFNEFQAVIVRSALASFGRALAYRVHETLYESVARLGFLCVPTREAMYGSPHRGAYEALPGSETVFRRVR
ncbi:MAG: protein-glutamate O-methyltransferase CheR [Vulcanimicrobiaceae bacterium]